jgi:hypothetical protein
VKENWIVWDLLIDGCGDYNLKAPNISVEKIYLEEPRHLTKE